MTTEVSSRPRSASDTIAIDGLFDCRVDVRAEPARVDPWRTGRRLRDRCAWNEAARRQRPELRHGYPVAGDGDDLARLHFAQDRRGVVPKLALRHDSSHLDDG